MNTTKDNLIREAVNAAVEKVLKESNNDAIINDIVEQVLSNEEYLKKAIQCLSPQYSYFPKGTKKQQQTWRMDEFITSNPELFKQLPSFAVARKATKVLYDALSRKYPNHF